MQPSKMERSVAPQRARHETGAAGAENFETESMQIGPVESSTESPYLPFECVTRRERVGRYDQATTFNVGVCTYR